MKSKIQSTYLYHFQQVSLRIHVVLNSVFDQMPNQRWVMAAVTTPAPINALPPTLFSCLRA